MGVWGLGWVAKAMAGGDRWSGGCVWGFGGGVVGSTDVGACRGDADVEACAGEAGWVQAGHLHEVGPPLL